MLRPQENVLNQSCGQKNPHSIDQFVGSVKLQTFHKIVKSETLKSSTFDI